MEPDVYCLAGKSYEFSAPSNKIALSAYIDELKFLLDKQKQLLKAIAELLAKNGSLQKQYEVIENDTLHMGSLSAMTILFTEIGDINRFKKPEHLFSYCGIKHPIAIIAERASIREG